MADYLTAQSVASPEQKEHFDELLDTLTKKLWHQFAVKLTEVIKLPFFLSESRLLGLFDNVVQKISKNLNQLSYVSFSVAASKQHKDAKASLKFLRSISDTVKEDTEATVMCNMEMARLKVKLNLIEDCKALLEEAEKTMNDFMGIVDTTVQSHFYLASMEYYKANGPAASYFKNSLLYLTYTPLESIPIADQVTLAADVSLAAVLGEGIYNFGELLQHPVAMKLKDTPKEWVSELLLAFNKGDIAAYKKNFAAKSKSEETLKKAKPFLDEKIRIMALIEMVFTKDARSRTISFDEIASTCDCKLVEVEQLLMKSFSLGVLKGLIDQVENNVTVKWCQARVLDVKQLASIRDRLKDWSEQVSSAATYLESNAPELLTVS